MPLGKHSDKRSTANASSTAVLPLSERPTKKPVRSGSGQALADVLFWIVFHKDFSVRVGSPFLKGEDLQALAFVICTDLHQSSAFKNDSHLCGD